MALLGQTRHGAAMRPVTVGIPLGHILALTPQPHGRDKIGAVGVLDLVGTQAVPEEPSVERCCERAETLSHIASN